MLTTRPTSWPVRWRWRNSSNFIADALEPSHNHQIPCDRITANSTGLCGACSSPRIETGIPLSALLSPAYIPEIAVSNFTQGSFLRVGATFSPSDQEKARSLQDEIRKLQDKLNVTAGELQKEKLTSAGHKKAEAELRSTLEELGKKQQLAFLLDRVSPKGPRLFSIPDNCAESFLRLNRAHCSRCRSISEDRPN